MRRANRSVCVLLLIVSSAACLSLASGSAVAAEEERTAEHRSSGQVDRAKTRRHCVKRKNASKAKRRSCRKAKQRRQEPLVVAPTSNGSTDVPPAAGPAPSSSPEPPRSSPEPIPEPNEEEPEPPLEETPPKEEPPLPVTRHCELVAGDCSIYSDKFWELLAKYRRFEIGTGVYPNPPHCMEGWEEGAPIVCVEAIAFLYPDGTIGISHWIIDPCEPKGWRFADLNPPCSPPEEQ